MSPERLAGESLGIDIREDPAPAPEPEPEKPPQDSSGSDRPVINCPCPKPGMYRRCFRFPCIYAPDSAYRPPF